MANMSYCRFQNTYGDLADCVEAFREIVEDGESISKNEWNKAKSIKVLCEQYLELWEMMEYEGLQPNIDDM